MDWSEGYIAVDWGTTNRRAYLVDHAGRLISEFEDSLGVMTVPPDGFARAAEEIRERLGDRPMLLAGMVGSTRGWREAAYVACPADLDAIAGGITWIEPGRTGIVPGVSQRGVAGADVMRGEEVQILGAVAAGLAPADGLICHPGTHAKWIATAAGRIVAFKTMMTGEVFGLLTRHSILADQLGGVAGRGEAFQAGLDDVLSGRALLASLFGIRARVLLGESGGDEVSYASGLLIGHDVKAGLGLVHRSSVTLIGRTDLCLLYQTALDAMGRSSTVVDGATAFRAGMHHLAEKL